MTFGDRAARVVEACCRASVLVVAAFVAATVLAGAYVVRNFALDTDAIRLISTDLRWRQLERDFDRLFPHRSNLLVLVIDGPTPERAEEVATRLAERLAARPDVARSVRRPDGGPFFARNGLLFRPLPDVQRSMGQLVQAQPFLGTLAADPSLRGVFESIALLASGVQAGATRWEDFAPALASFADAFEALAAGREPAFSWQALFSGEAPAPRSLRRFVLVQPVLDFAALEPGRAASEAIRALAREAGATERDRIGLRLTGQVALADEEFATITEGAALNLALTIGLVLVILWLALHSARLILAVFVTLLVGLALTGAVGLAIVGTFNVISIAFAVLFVGLGVDFGIQYAVRYRSERFAGAGLEPALARAASGVGGPLLLAAASVAAGFYAFLPTAYRGVSELGIIAGTGMMIAFATSLTLLPALVRLLRPRGEQPDPGFAFLAAADRFFARHRAAVLWATAFLCVAGIPYAETLRFDANPINLRSQQVESVATLIDLQRDPATNPSIVDALAPNVEAAAELANRLARLPEVAQAVTLASFVPEGQTEKLAAIEDAANLLGPTLEPPETRPAPDLAELRASAAELRRALTAAPAPASPEAADRVRRMVRALEAIASGPPDAFARARRALVEPLGVTLQQIRDALSATRVTLDDLPPDLERDWRAPDGRVRVEIVPAGDPTDSAALERFATAVRAVAPDASGGAISIHEAAKTVVRSFLEAGVWAFLSITLILAVTLRRVADVAWTVLPLLVSGLLTLEAASFFGMPLNFANIIALPLMFGVGVAFHIYYVIAWRHGVADVLQTSLTRAILFSALTTGVAFGSLWLSSHPGTASMGALLSISLVFTLLVAFVIVPACLGPPREGTARGH